MALFRLDNAWHPLKTCEARLVNLCHMRPGKTLENRKKSTHSL